MILIADSGGSKTDWALVEEENADNRQILISRRMLFYMLWNVN